MGKALAMPRDSNSLLIGSPQSNDGSYLSSGYVFHFDYNSVSGAIEPRQRLGAGYGINLQ